MYFKKQISIMIVICVIFVFTGSSAIVFANGYNLKGSKLEMGQTDHETNIIAEDENIKIVETISRDGFVSRGILNKKSNTIILEMKSNSSYDKFKEIKIIDLNDLDNKTQKNDFIITPQYIADSVSYKLDILGSYGYIKEKRTTNEYLELYIPDEFFITPNVSGSSDLEEQIRSKGDWFKSQIETANDFTDVALNGIIGFIPGASEVNTIKSIMEDSQEMYEDGLSLDHAVNSALTLFGLLPWVGEFINGTKVTTGTSLTIASLTNASNTYYDIKELSEGL